MAIGQQHGLYRFGLLARGPDPGDDRILFVPFGPGQAADPIPLRNLGQGIDDLSFWRAATIEKRPFGFRKRLPTCLALLALPTSFGLAILDDIVLLIAL